MRFRKIVVLITGAAAFSLLLAIGIVSNHRKTGTIEMACPVFGNRDAAIEVLLFEDFRCYGCRTFNENILPRIESEYLAKGLVQLKIVPLGFLNGSKILANSALEVYWQAPDRFSEFAKLLFLRFEQKPPAASDLFALTKEVGGIDLVKFKSCIEKKCHYGELERNLELARSLMGKKFLIPSLFVNGVRVNATDFQTIQKEIEK